MKRILSLLVLNILINSCSGYGQKKGYERFKLEFNDNLINKLEINSPYPFEDKIIANYKYYPYFEIFGNAGINIQFNIAMEDQDRLLNGLKSTKIIDNDSIVYNKENISYLFVNQNSNVQIPAIGEDFSELSLIELNNKEEVCIYLLEKGTILNAFKDNNDGVSQVYNYSIGVYFFKKHSIILYWFLVY